MEFLNFWCKCRKSAKGKTPKREQGEGRKGRDDETRHSFHFIDGVRNGRNGKWSMVNAGQGEWAGQMKMRMRMAMVMVMAMSLDSGRETRERGCYLLLATWGLANKFVVVRSLNLARNRAICIIRIRGDFA